MGDTTVAAVVLCRQVDIVVVGEIGGLRGHQGGWRTGRKGRRIPDPVATGTPAAVAVAVAVAVIVFVVAPVASSRSASVRRRIIVVVVVVVVAVRFLARAIVVAVVRRNGNVEGLSRPRIHGTTDPHDPIPGMDLEFFSRSFVFGNRDPKPGVVIVVADIVAVLVAVAAAPVGVRRRRRRRRIARIAVVVAIVGAAAAVCGRGRLDFPTPKLHGRFSIAIGAWDSCLFVVAVCCCCCCCCC
mmetsp:Transcript_117215/g.239831  ORF Transcript_117215/g.239831 Transcript_117215/m.239831 type:complete len:241 (+) Transcript_117215:257-979(+)